MNARIGRASGKLILCGEHAVVHGTPAIAFAVDLGTTARLEAWEGPTHAPARPDDTALTAALGALLGPDGWRVHLETDLPVGRGMGSSAALAVAVVRAHTPDATPEHIFERAMAAERVFHGNPSGLDVLVSARGGVVRYLRAGPAFRPLPTPRWSAVILDSGVAGNTGTLVAGVASRRPGIDPLLDRIGALVDEAVQVLDDAPALGELLVENHRLLAGIGVSTPTLDDLVALALDEGAHGAKLSGAGGGGVVLALTDDPERLVAAATRRGIAARTCRPTEA